MAPSSGDILGRAEAEVYKLWTCPEAALCKLQSRSGEAAFKPQQLAALQLEVDRGHLTPHHELAFLAHQQAGSTHPSSASATELQSLAQQASSAWIANLLVGSRKQPGMQQLFKDQLAGAANKALPRLLRYTAHWLYLHILQHAWSTDQGPYQSALSCTEPLFQLLPPHQQLQLVGEVLGELCQEEPSMDSLLHTATLLSLVRLAGQLAQVEAACAGHVDWSEPGSTQPQAPPTPVEQLLCQPQNQPLAVAGRFVSVIPALRTPLRSAHGPLALAPTAATSPSCVAAICCHMMQQSVAIPLALCSAGGPQPSAATKNAYKRLSEALGDVVSAWERAAQLAAQPEAAGAAAAAAGSSPAPGPVAAALLQQVQGLLRTLSPWRGAAATAPPAGGDTSDAGAAEAQARSRPAAAAGARGTAPITWRRPSQQLLLMLRSGLTAWETCVLLAAGGAAGEGPAGGPLSDASGATPAEAAPLRPGGVAGTGAQQGSSSRSTGSDMADSARTLRDQQQQQPREGLAQAALPAKARAAASSGLAVATSPQPGSCRSSGGVPHPLLVVVRMLLTALVARTQLECNKVFGTADEVRATAQRLLLLAHAPLAAAQEVVEAAERLLTTRLATHQLDQQQRQQQGLPAQRLVAARRQQLLQLRCAEAALAAAQSRLGSSFQAMVMEVTAEGQKAMERRVFKVSAMVRSELRLCLDPLHVEDELAALGAWGWWQQQQVGTVMPADATAQTLHSKYASQQQQALQALLLFVAGGPTARSPPGQGQRQGYSQGAPPAAPLDAGTLRQVEASLVEAQEELCDLMEALAQEAPGCLELVELVEEQILVHRVSEEALIKTPQQVALWEKYGRRRVLLLQGMQDMLALIAAAAPPGQVLQFEVWPGRTIWAETGRNDRMGMTYGKWRPTSRTPTPDWTPSASPMPAIQHAGGGSSSTRPSSGSSSSRSSRGPSPMLHSLVSPPPQQQQQQARAGHPPPVSIPGSSSLPPTSAATSGGGLLSGNGPTTGGSGGGAHLRDMLSNKVAAAIDALLPDLPAQPSPLDAAGKGAYKGKMCALVSVIHNLAKLERTHPQPDSSLANSNIQRLTAAAKGMVDITRTATGSGVKKSLPCSPFEPRVLAEELMKSSSILSPAARQRVGEVAIGLVSLPRPAFASGSSRDDIQQGGVDPAAGVASGGSGGVGATAAAPHPPGLQPLSEQSLLPPPGLKQAGLGQQQAQQQQAQSRSKGLVSGFLSRPNTSAAGHSYTSSSGGQAEAGSGTGIAAGAAAIGPPSSMMQIRGGAPSDATLSNHSSPGSSIAGSWFGSDPGSPVRSSSSSMADGQLQQGGEGRSGALCLRLRGGMPSEPGSNASSSSNTPRPLQRPPASAACGGSSATRDVVLQAWAFTTYVPTLPWPDTTSCHMQHAHDVLLSGDVREGVSLATAASVLPALTRDEEEQSMAVLSELQDLHCAWLLQEPALSLAQGLALQAWWGSLPQLDRLCRLQAVRAQLFRQHHQQQRQARPTSRSFMGLLWELLVADGGAAALPPGDQALTLAHYRLPPPTAMPAADEATRLVLAELSRQLVAVSRVKALLEVAVGAYLPACSQHQHQPQQVAGSAAAAAAGMEEEQEQLREEVGSWVAQVVLAGTLLQKHVRLLLQVTCLASAPASIAAAAAAEEAVLGICCGLCAAVPLVHNHSAPWLHGWQELVPGYLLLVAAYGIPSGPAQRLPQLLAGRCSVEAQQTAAAWMRRCAGDSDGLVPAQQQAALLPAAEMALWLMQAGHRGVQALPTETRKDWRPYAELYANRRSRPAQAVRGGDSTEAEAAPNQKAGRAGRQVASRSSGGHLPGSPQLGIQQQGQQQQAGSRRTADTLLSDSEDGEEGLVVGSSAGAVSAGAGGLVQHAAAAVQVPGRPRGRHAPGVSSGPWPRHHTAHMSPSPEDDEARALDDYHSISDSGSEAGGVAAASEDDQEVYGTPLGSAASSSSSQGGSIFLALGRRLAADAGSGSGPLREAAEWQPEPDTPPPGTDSASGGSAQLDELGWYSLARWLELHGFDKRALDQAVSEADEVDVEGLHSQVGAVLRVYSAEVSHMGRLLQPLAQRAARRLGELLEAKAPSLEPFSLGPLPAVDAPPGAALQLPNGDLLPCRDWLCVLTQQGDWLERLLHELQEQHAVVLGLGMQCKAYKPPEPDNPEVQVALADVISDKKHRALLPAWFCGVRALYVCLRSLAAPRFRGELRARQRRLRNKFKAMAELRTIWERQLGPSTPLPSSGQAQDFLDVWSAVHGLLQRQAALLTRMESTLGRLGSQLPQLLIHTLNLGANLHHSPVRMEVVRDPGRRSVNEARLQLLLYMARHRGISLPRGPVAVEHLGLAALQDGHGKFIHDPQVVEDLKLFIHHLHPWHWLSMRQHAAAYLSEPGTFRRPPRSKPCSYTGAHLASPPHALTAQSSSSSSSGVSGGDGSGGHGSSGGTLLRGRRSFRRRAGHHLPPDGWSARSFADSCCSSAELALQAVRRARRNGRYGGAGVGDRRSVSQDDSSSDCGTTISSTSSGPWCHHLGDKDTRKEAKLVCREQREGVRILVGDALEDLDEQQLGIAQAAAKVMVKASGLAQQQLGRHPEPQGGGLGQGGVAGGAAGGHSRQLAAAPAAAWAAMRCRSDRLMGRGLDSLYALGGWAWVAPHFVNWMGITLLSCAAQPTLLPSASQTEVHAAIQRCNHQLGQPPRMMSRLLTLLEQVSRVMEALLLATPCMGARPAVQALPPKQQQEVQELLGGSLRDQLVPTPSAEFRFLLWAALAQQKPGALAGGYARMAANAATAAAAQGVAAAAPYLHKLQQLLEAAKQAEVAAERAVDTPEESQKLGARDAAQQQLADHLFTYVGKAVVDCMASSVLCDLVQVPAAWRDLLGPGVGGGGRLSRHALCLPVKLKAAPHPDPAAAAAIAAAASGQTTKAAAHSSKTGKAAAPLQQQPPAAAAGTPARGGSGGGEAAPGSPAAAPPPAAQQASLLLVQVARAARSSYSSTYSPRGLLLSLLRVLVLAPAPQKLVDLDQLLEKPSAQQHWVGAAALMQAARDWGLQEGHTALVSRDWQQAVQEQPVTQPATAQGPLSQQQQQQQPSPDGTDGSAAAALASGSAAGSMSGSGGMDAALNTFHYLLLHSHHVRCPIAHRAWAQLMAQLQIFVVDSMQQLAASAKQQGSEAAVPSPTDVCLMLLPLVVEQLQTADVAELLQLLLGVGAGKEGPLSHNSGSSSSSTSAGETAAAAAAEVATGEGPAGWWQQHGAWQWRPQLADHPQKHRQQHPQQQQPCSSGMPPGGFSCWEACDWCQGQVPCSGHAGDSGSSSDDGKGPQDQQQQGQVGSGAGAVGGGWGCPHCGLARYCSAGCAAAAKELHNANCWRLTAMSRRDPTMSAWRLPSGAAKLHTPLFTFLARPSSQQQQQAVSSMLGAGGLQSAPSGSWDCT